MNLQHPGLGVIFTALLFGISVSMATLLAIHGGPMAIVTVDRFEVESAEGGCLLSVSQ